MSKQLDLFGMPAGDPERPKPPPRPKPKPSPEPLPPKDGPIHAAWPADDVQLEDRCIVIGCACVSMGAEIDGHPVCGQHDTDETRKVMATGSWPAWYGYEGKWRVVPTVRRLDDLGHSWEGAVFNEKTCATCGLRYAKWTQGRFETTCTEYVHPDMREGLFRP
jgi:hypothetical protein